MATRDEQIQALVNKGYPYADAVRQVDNAMGADDSSKEEKGGVVQGVKNAAGTVVGGLQNLGSAITEKVSEMNRNNSNKVAQQHNQIMEGNMSGSKGTDPKAAKAMAEHDQKNAIKDLFTGDKLKSIIALAKAADTPEAFYQSLGASAKGYGYDDPKEIIEEAKRLDIWNSQHPLTKENKDGSKRSDSDNGQFSGSGDDSGTNGNNNSNGNGNGNGKDPEDPPKKGRYYSVWDAYFKGAFGEPGSREAKGAAAYYTVDAIANYLKNVGKGLGNIGAQYTGGTVDNSESTSEWDKAMNVMNEEQRELWGEQQGGQRARKARAERADINTKELANKQLRTKQDVLDYADLMFKNAKTEAEKMYWGNYIRDQMDAVGSIVNTTALDLHRGFEDFRKNWNNK